MPHGNIHYDQVRSADRHGTAGQFQMFTGTSTASHIALFDANGNLIDGGAASTTTIVVETNTVAVGTRGTLNLIAGTNVTITGVDNAGAGSVDVTIAASGSGGGGASPSFFGLVNFTAPPTTGWSWDNQGAATVDTTNANVLYLSLPKVGAVAARIYYRTAPATPYTITACILHDLSITDNASNASDYSLWFRQSSTGKLIRWGIDNGSNITVQTWTNSSTFTSTLKIESGIGLEAAFRSPAWMRMGDDGTNLNFYWSIDGIHWELYFSVARGTFMTGGPDQIGIGSYVNASGTRLGLIHWA